MKKLQAAMHDKSAKAWRENTVMYKVGSHFKGCHRCGEYEVEDGGNRKRYSSGFQVFRSYYPSRTKWTYWCWDCGAKDALAWENPIDIGSDAIRGTRDAVKSAKKLLRGRPLGGEKVEVPDSPEIAALRRMILELESKIKGGVGA